MTAEALANLHKAAFPQDPWSAEALSALLSDPSVRLIARPQGFILLRVILDEAELLTVAVAPADQGQGHGRALLALALGAARESGAARVFLEVAADNAPAQALYARAGFVQIGLRKGYYRRPDGGRVDAALLECRLA